MMNQNSFIQALESFENDLKMVSKKEDVLAQKKDKLKQDIEKILSVKSAGLHCESMLAMMIEDLYTSIQQNFNHWEAELESSLPMKVLSDLYHDRIIFLVFGKVNAGKSSFSNFIADLFPPNQIKRFRFNQGKVVYFKERFAEGVTETTASIQGVELGKNFVLLDSPGLHSVTDKNGDLTRRFTDSTDAILWLTPSTSPGQVQELNDLKEELAKKKPLLPIITRSDTLDESLCEKTQDIIQVLINKSAENRQSQQNDVIARLKDFEGIDSKIIKDALSISVHAYQASSKKDKDLIESGLSDLFKGLVIIIKEAKAYKVKKAEQQMINFLDSKVLATLQKEVTPIIQKLNKETKATIDSLNKKKQRLASVITADVASEVTNIVNRHKDARDKKAISVELNQLIEGKLNKSLQEELSSFVSELKQTSSTLSADALGDFESITIDVKQVKGGVAKSASTAVGGIGGASGGAVAGAMLGSVVPIIGNVVGGILGGILGGVLGGAAGSTVGDYFVETETITENVGVSTEKVIKKTTDSINKLLPKIIDAAFLDVIKMIEPVGKLCVDLEKEIQRFATDITNLKG